MSDVTINYKGSSIATMDASGTKTLLTEGQYCEDDIEVVYVSPGGGGSSVAHGTFTPTERTQTASFDTGLTTITGILIVPHDESPFKSGGKTAVGFIGTPNSYYKAMIMTSNNAGASMLTPPASTTATQFTQSGTTVTVRVSGTGSTLNGGYFETITYDWWAW